MSGTQQPRRNSGARGGGSPYRGGGYGDRGHDFRGYGGDGGGGGDRGGYGRSPGRGRGSGGYGGGRARRGRHEDFVPSADGKREQGFVEKIKDSYGFIDCMERDGSLFFHFSAFDGYIEDLHIGSEVEFSVAEDQRSGKFVAQNMSLLAPGSVTAEELDETVYQGKVTRVARAPRPNSTAYGQSPSRQDMSDSGRITYETANKDTRRTTFAAADQADPAEKVRQGDVVSFKLCRHRKSGIARAVQVAVVERAPITETKGIISSVKEMFGFIEREDVAQEIFFHYSEYHDGNPPRAGAEVVFEIGRRQDKQVALNVRVLPKGSVVLETIGQDRLEGEVTASIKRTRDRRAAPESLLGHIALVGEDGATHDVTFGERDMAAGFKDGAYLLGKGDTVEFNVAIDKRTSKRRAVEVARLKEAFNPDDVRETGVITTLKDGYGFIKCADRESRMFFHFSELLDPTAEPTIGTEVGFNVQEQNRGAQADSRKADKSCAVKIKFLPPGSVQFEVEAAERTTGVVQRAPVSGSSANSSWDRNRRDSSSASAGSRGLIEYSQEGEKRSVTFRDQDVTDVRTSVGVGDTVSFLLVLVKRTGAHHATKVEVLERAARNESPPKSGRQQGAISDLKENFGFLETSDAAREVFFHFSEFQGNAPTLKVCDRVAYELTERSGRTNAVRVVKLSPEEIDDVEVLEEETFEGRITRQRHSSSDGTNYGGRVRVIMPQKAAVANPGEEAEGGAAAAAAVAASAEVLGEELPFGITSLVDPQKVLQVHEKVSFRIAINPETDQRRACQLQKVADSSSQKHHAKIKSVKENFGFLSFQVDDKDTLYFNTRAVESDTTLQPGDEVEFSLAYNARAQRYSAVSLRLLQRAEPARRPLRMSRKASASEQSGPRFGLKRQPSGPDGSLGFGAGRGGLVKVEEGGEAKGLTSTAVATAGDMAPVAAGSEATVNAVEAPDAAASDATR